MPFLRRSTADDRGVTGVEYALIAGLIAVVVAGGAVFVGPAVSAGFVTAGSAAGGGAEQATAGTEGLCAGVFVTDPVTCDPGIGVSVAACTNGVSGDGSEGAPWACAPAPVDLCDGVFVTDPVTCTAGVVDTSMCTNGVSGDGSEGAPWTCIAPTPPAAPTIGSMSKSNCDRNNKNCDVSLSWSSVSGATRYRWEYVDDNGSFTCGARSFEESGTTGGTSATITDEYDSNDWTCFRVRVDAPSQGDWVYSTTRKL